MRVFFNCLRSIILWKVFFTGVFIIASIYPILNIFPGKHEKLFQGMNKFFLSLALKLSFINVEVIGSENIPHEGGFIIAANHSSFLDNIVLLGRLPFLFKIVADRSGFSLPLIRRVYKGAGYIRTGIMMGFEDMVVLYKCLRSKENVLIYSFVAKGSELGRFTDAMINFSKQTGAPILPVCLKGCSKILPMNKFILTDGMVSVRIGNPIHDPDLKLLQDKMKELYY